MTSIPPELRYTAEHEWVSQVSEGTARVGITAHAADALGDIVFLDLPAVGTEITAGAPCGEIESTKSVSELFAPVDGVVTAVNQAAAEEPGIVNGDPYGAGWLFEMTPDGGAEHLLDAAAYRAIADEA